MFSPNHDGCAVQPSLTALVPFGCFLLKTQNAFACIKKCWRIFFRINESSGLLKLLLLQ